MKLHNLLLPLSAVLLLVTACTDTSVPGPQPLRTRHIYTQARSGSDSLPQTRIAFDDKEEEGMATRWETTDAFKGYYTTPQVQQTLQTAETVALFSYAEPSLSDQDNRARFEADVADDVDATTVFNFFYPSWRTSGLTWADTRASLEGQKQQGNASTAHLSLYNYLNATNVTDIEHASEPIAFHPLLALLRFDLTLQDYDATRDGLPQRFSLQSEGEQPFYHSIQANGQGLEASSYLDLQLQDIDPTTSATDGLPANTLRLYCATAPTTLHPARLSLNVYCSNGARYTTKVNATADATTVSWQAGTRYRTDALVLKRLADDANVSVFDNSTQASDKFNGSGTQADPYLIASAGDLKLLVQQVSERGNKYSGKYFRLATDLRIETDTWTPIGLRTGDGSWDGSNYPFCAHFDGNGHTISGQLNGSGLYFGLFGLAGVGFGLSNLHLRADVSNDYPYNNVARAVSTGGLVGCLEAAGSNPIRIQGCTFSGILRSAAGGNNVGGLVGMATSSLNMTGCINRGTLSATNNTGSSTSLSQNLGGLVGFAKGTVSLSDCANYGSLSTTNNNEIVYAGGLLGLATSAVCQLRNTDNYADVFPATNSNPTVGGLVGLIYNGQLHTSTNHATLTTGSGTRGSLIGSKGGSLTVNDCCTDQGNTGLPLCADQATTQPCDEKHRKGL